jgi:hypothetical protein
VEYINIKNYRIMKIKKIYGDAVYVQGEKVGLSWRALEFLKYRYNGEINPRIKRILTKCFWKDFPEKADPGIYFTGVVAYPEPDDAYAVEIAESIDMQQGSIDTVRAEPSTEKKEPWKLQYTTFTYKDFMVGINISFLQPKLSEEYWNVGDNAPKVYKNWIEPYI